ncbi:MAG: hypothetical protein LUG21_07750 [Clostridiales bacterium]|nr:hypothetical protein [Clostridiales bacterium]
MNRESFINYLNGWYIKNSTDAQMHLKDYSERALAFLEKHEADGDFVFEDDNIAVGKYYYSVSVPDWLSKSGTCESLRFCVYGAGTKCRVKDDDYELESYDEFLYVIL